MPGKHVRAPHWHTFPQMLFVFPPQSEVATGVKKTSPLPSPERLENVLFGPHDCSHAPSDGYPVVASDGPVPVQKQASLFPDQREEDAPPETKCLIATAVITLFNEPSAEESGKGPLTVAQKKAQNIMESFENPFRMFLPSLERRAHVSQAAKFDPSSKIYEVSGLAILSKSDFLGKGDFLII
uniref:exosome component 10-like n=1 Tax=Panthera onca TaxID=9690 RepID=UPI0029553BE7|nr:exosome component 10-like [Panthera onca]